MIKVFEVNGENLNFEEVQARYNGFNGMILDLFKGAVSLESRNSITSKSKYHADDVLALLPRENDKYIWLSLVRNL